MTEEANGNQQAASTENGAKPPEIDYEAKYREAVAHSREWEKRAKDNKAAADELQQLKEAQLSEAEKTAKHIKELEAKNAAYEAEKQQNEWKTQVSKETGVPIALLHGSTLEEMQANGKALADYIAENNIIGGRYMLVHSVELERILFDSYALAVFCDSAVVTNDFSDHSLVSGAGFGIHWNAPFGQLRLDLAAPVEDVQLETIRIHFSIGADL